MRSLLTTCSTAGSGPISIRAILECVQPHPTGPFASPYAVWESSSGSTPPNTPAHHRTADLGTKTHPRSRFTTLVVRPRATFVASGESIRTSVGGQTTRTSSGNPFTALRRWRETLSPLLPSESEWQSAFRGAAPPFRGGVIGWIAYDSARWIEPIRGLAADSIEPEMMFLASGSLIIVDHETAHISVSTPTQEGRSDGPPPECEHDELVGLIESTLLRSADLDARQQAGADPFDRPSGDRTPLEFTERFSKDAFAERVRRAIEYIRAGDIFQVVLSNEFRARKSVDACAVFEHLRNTNPSPYHFAVHGAGLSIVGASPEVMLRSVSAERGTVVSMRPVAGTYPVQDELGREENPGGDGKADRTRGITPLPEAPSGSSSGPRSLAADSKERAEHLMLVDHARNDIGRVAQIGSVRVRDLFSVETYSHVHHLVSEVSGMLRPECDTIDALASCFPIATLTGTPKIRAMEIIAELEGNARGIFGGALVTLAPDGTLDSAVAIRFLRTSDSETIVRTGAGIVVDSDPEREYHECKWKAASLFAAVDGTVPTTARDDEETASESSAPAHRERSSR